MNDHSANESSANPGQNTRPAILIIFGSTGDLSKRKLLPAIAELLANGSTPPLRIVGLTRKSDVSPASLVEKMKDPNAAKAVEDILEMLTLNPDEAEGYEKLATRLKEIEAEVGQPCQRLFYLSVPPNTTEPIVSHLGTSGLSKIPDTKLLMEKPFGSDEASAKELIEHISKSFSAEQVYRIDHYLAKDMAQKFIIFRRDNPLFRRTWNADFIERIEILATESIGIENRAEFYEETGALRDLIQSHLLQLTALTLMEIPDDDSGISNARKNTLAALRALPEDSIRGQYKTYRDEVKNPESMTETFASLSLESSDPTWKGVPIKVLTGKALAEKRTEIRITYKHDTTSSPNTLTINLGANEGVELCVFAKDPSHSHGTACIPLSFTYPMNEIPDAYSRVFLDAIHGDRAVFVTSDEIIEAWRIVDSVRDYWTEHSSELKVYENGAAPEKVE